MAAGGIFPRNASADGFGQAADLLRSAVDAGDVAAASLFVRRGGDTRADAFGAAPSPDAIFLVASITKPMSVATLMGLADRGRLTTDAPVRRYLPEFHGQGRERVTVADLLTHRSGLPDQLPRNHELRGRHAPLSDFVTGALATPLAFPPGSRYRYSSMGILLASEIAQRVSDKPFPELMREIVFEPLGMNRSALGLGRWGVGETMRCQVERSAPESGGGSEESRDWDWNSDYWRNLAAPWGGGHASAPDIARFLDAFLAPPRGWLRQASIDPMITNRNPPGWPPRGFGFGLGPQFSSPACSPATFGHGGATGTLAWADPDSDTTCVVLTTLPGNATKPHPRQLASDRIGHSARIDHRDGTPAAGES